MNTPNPPGFTLSQYQALSAEQKTVVDAVLAYGKTPDKPAPQSGDLQSLATAYPAAEPSSQDQIIGDIRGRIRRRFASLYAVAAELAETELAALGHTTPQHFQFTLLVDADWVCPTHVAVVDFARGACYLHEWKRVSQFHFATLAQLAEEVLRIKRHLVTQIVKARRPIQIEIEGGLIKAMHHIPPGLQVQVIEYDVDGFEPEDLQRSPLNGQPCLLNTFPPAAHEP